MLKRRDFQEILERFYKISGWGRRTGVLTFKKLKELGLEEITNDLVKFVRVH